MRLSTKIIVWAWVVLFVVVGSLIYGAYSKLNPDSLVSLLNEQIQKSYPGANLKIEKIDYRFLLDFDLRLKSLAVTKENKTYVSAQEVQLRIPWWLILLDKGRAQINVTDLVVYVSYKEPPHLTKKDVEVSKSPLDLSIPKYLADARYTLRAKNISFKEMNGDRHFVTFSKLLVREFQFAKSSAFEINVPVTVTHRDKKYSSDLWLFGDISPEHKNWSLSYRGEFKAKDSVDGQQFEDLVIDGKTTFVLSSVNFVTNLDLYADRKKIGTGKFEAIEERMNFSLVFSELPLEYFSFFENELKNPFLLNMKGLAAGEVTFDYDPSKEVKTNLTAKFHFPGEFSFDAGSVIKGQWDFNIRNDRWITTFSSSTGDLKFSRKSDMDMNKIQLKQFDQEINFQFCDFNLALSSVISLNELINSDESTSYTALATFQKCSESGNIFDGSFKYGISPSGKFYFGAINSANTKFQIKYATHPEGNKFNADFLDFPWSASYKFLMPYFGPGQGVLNGRVTGDYLNHWSDGRWIMNLKAKVLANVKGQFFSLDSQAWNFFQIDSTLFSDRSWSVGVEKDTIKLKTINFDGANTAVLSGLLTSQLGRKSYLTLDYPENKKWKPVQKDISETFWKENN